jgi:hypothetical protein
MRDAPKEDLIKQIESSREESRNYKNIIENLYRVIVRALVLFKYLIRLLAVLAAYRWLGHNEAYMLAGFIAVTALIQLGIDKTRKAVNPKLKLSEWDVTFDILE